MFEVELLVVFVVEFLVVELVLELLLVAAVAFVVLLTGTVLLDLVVLPVDEFRGVELEFVVALLLVAF